MKGGGVDDCRLILGDCLEVLPTLEAGSIDAIVTDPPYSSGGAFRGDRVMDPTVKYVCDHEVKNFHGSFTGDNRDQRSYGYWCALWLGQCLRIAKPGSPILLFTDWRQLPGTTDALQAGGWVWRGIVVWDKTDGARPQKGRFKQQAEFVVWGSKGPMPVERRVDCLGGVFRAAPFQGKQHIAGKPVVLMRSLLEICEEGGTVLDPFAGSGTTGIACLQTGRKFVGVELDPEYHALARRRFAALQGGPSHPDAREVEAEVFGPLFAQAPEGGTSP